MSPRGQAHSQSTFPLLLCSERGGMEGGGNLQADLEGKGAEEGAGEEGGLQTGRKGERAVMWGRPGRAAAMVQGSAACCSQGRVDSKPWQARIPSPKPACGSGQANTVNRTRCSITCRNDCLKTQGPQAQRGAQCLHSQAPAEPSCISGARRYLINDIKPQLVPSLSAPGCFFDGTEYGQCRGWLAGWCGVKDPPVCQPAPRDHRHEEP